MKENLLIFGMSPGQKRNVQVRRFIAQGTFEEKINQMLRIVKPDGGLRGKMGWRTF